VRNAKLLLAVSAISAALGLAPYTSPASAETITVAGWGGTLQDAERKAFFEPAAKALGIEIKEDSLDGIAPFRAQVMSGSPAWDIVELDSSTCALAQIEGLTEPLDYNVIDASGVNDAMKGRDWVGIFAFSVVLAWTEDGSARPKTWAEFFDGEKFKLPRSLYNSPMYALEAALMADGVDPKKLYPLDVDRGFSVLERVKPQVAAWWKTGAHSVQLVRNGEVDALGIFNGRISELRKAGVKMNYTYENGILDFDCLMVAKGSKHKEAAMKVLNEFLKAKNQATFSTLIDYGPVNAKAFDTGIISAERASELASAPKNAEKMVVLNPTFWAENLPKIQSRFDMLIQE
jgi:putative spermidine/putrescine transport system substrate-binding protein